MESQDFDYKKPHYGSLFNAIEKYSRKVHTNYAFERLEQTARFVNELFHPDDPLPAWDWFPFLDRMRDRVDSLASLKGPKYKYWCGTEASLIYPTQSNKVYKYYPSWDDKGVQMTTKRSWIIDQNYDQTGPLSLNTVEAAKKSFESSNLWSLTAPSNLKDEGNYLCVIQPYWPTPLNLSEMANAVNRTRGVLLPETYGKSPILVYVPQTSINLNPYFFSPKWIYLIFVKIR